MAQTDLESARTGQWTSTNLSAANTALTLTLAAGGAGTVIRLHKVVVSSSVSAAAADSSLTIKPDGSTSSYVEFLGATQGPLADRNFNPPIYGKDNTNMTIVVSAFGGTSKSQVTAVYDYKDQSARKV